MYNSLSEYVSVSVFPIFRKPAKKSRRIQDEKIAKTNGDLSPKSPDFDFLVSLASSSFPAAAVAGRMICRPREIHAPGIWRSQLVSHKECMRLHDLRDDSVAEYSALPSSSLNES